MELTLAHIVSGLSKLGISADGTKSVYLQLDLSGRELGSILPLGEYTHLQELDISNNQLEDVSRLGSLKHLLSLDASRNHIPDLLAFDPPCSLLQVDYSSNRISALPDLSQHRFLQLLLLDDNKIDRINGLSSLSELRVLSLRCNNISKLEGLPAGLQELYLGGNRIARLEAIDHLHDLTVFDMSANELTTTVGMIGENHCRLFEVSFANNGIAEVASVADFAASLPLLRRLNVTGNPVVGVDSYRWRVIFSAPQLLLLDGADVTVEDKVAATNRYAPPHFVVAARKHAEEYEEKRVEYLEDPVPQEDTLRAPPLQD